MAIIDLKLSPSTSKHVSAVEAAVPLDVTVLRFHLGSTWGQWQNVDLIDKYHPFDQKARMRLVEYWLDGMYKKHEEVLRCCSLTVANTSLCVGMGYIKILNELYKNDASLAKWLRQPIPSHLSDSARKQYRTKRRMVKGLLAGMKKEEIIDLMFGEGTWKAYEDRISHLRKAERTREYVKKVNEYLLQAQVWGRPPYSKEVIETLTPLQRINIKFRSIERQSKEYQAMEEHRKKSYDRAVKYIGLDREKYTWSEKVLSVTNRFTGEIIYKVSPYQIFHQREKCYVTFGSKDFEKFCNAPDKKQWLRRFYTMCAIKQGRVEADANERKIRQNEITEDDLTPAHLANLYAYRERFEKYRREVEEAELRREAEYAEMKAREEMEREEKKKNWRSTAPVVWKVCAIFGANTLTASLTSLRITTNTIMVAMSCFASRTITLLRQVSISRFQLAYARDFGISWTNGITTLSHLHQQTSRLRIVAHLR